MFLRQYLIRSMAGAVETGIEVTSRFIVVTSLPFLVGVAFKLPPLPIHWAPLGVMLIRLLMCVGQITMLTVLVQLVRLDFEISLNQGKTKHKPTN